MSALFRISNDLYVQEVFLLLLWLLSQADTMGARLETVLSVLHDPKSRCRGQNPEDRMDFVSCSFKTLKHKLCYITTRPKRLQLGSVVVDCPYPLFD